MRIEKINVLNGPNYWSVYRKQLIVLLLDLQEMEQYPTDQIDGFYERLAAILPSMHEHRCSEGREGGFFSRVKEGTWMGHVIEHIALEIQTLAGMDTGFGRTRAYGKAGTYQVVFSYLLPRAGIYAATAATNLAEALIAGTHYDLEKDLQALRQIAAEDAFGPSTESIITEATNRGIPVTRLNDDSLVQLGYGANQQRIQATIAGTTSYIAVEIASDKKATKKLLEAVGVPVPAGGTATSEEELKRVVEELGYPVALKPRNGNQGKGATIGINNWEETLIAFSAAKKYSSRIICEKSISGEDFRALVINYQFVAAARRKAATIVGDGVHTIQELIEKENTDSRRGNGHQGAMTKISVNDSTVQLLQKNGHHIRTILPAGEECVLKTTANLSTGGTALDVTDEVHPANIELFNRVARVIGLDICGIDIIAPTLSTPIKSNGGVIIEVNAAPGFRMHLQPSEGKPRNVAAPVLDMLFPENKPATIPIIAVTGTNGKTTTSFLLAHICRHQGFVTGNTTTEGVFINGEKVMEGDCTGPVSAQVVLRDPRVEVAVLECARGGILRGGLAFQACDLAIITNIAGDHLGLGGINTVEQLARVKSVVAETVKASGYVVLNADDDLVYKIKNNVSCQIALFSLNEKNQRVTKHCRQGGIAAVYANGNLVIVNGSERILVEAVAKIPLSLNGKATFNIYNLLGAVLTAYLFNRDITVIRSAISSFIPSPEFTPGRMNIFNFEKFTVVIDYAHNPHGVRAIGDYIRQVDATTKLGVVTGIGDRREEDLVELGREVGKVFDEIVIRMDDCLRGRSQEEILELVSRGIKLSNEAAGIQCIPDEEEAVRSTIESAKDGSFIVVLVDKVSKAIEIARECKLKEEEKLGRGTAAPVHHR